MIRKTTSEAPLFWSAPEQQAGVLPQLVLLQYSGRFSRSNVSERGEKKDSGLHGEETPVTWLKCKRFKMQQQKYTLALGESADHFHHQTGYTKPRQ